MTYCGRVKRAHYNLAPRHRGILRTVKGAPKPRLLTPSPAPSQLPELPLVSCKGMLVADWSEQSAEECVIPPTDRRRRRGDPLRVEMDPMAG